VGTFGSRSTAVAGSAVVRAVEALSDCGRARVAGELECPPELVRFERGEFVVGGHEVALGDLVGLHASARFEAPAVFSSGAYVADVAIDPETGRLEVRRIVAVDDAGTIINPLLARGQIEGGIAQGVGECLLEEAVYDVDGQLRTATFLDYALPGAGEVPEIVIGEVSSPSPLNPLGAKGVGEGGTIGSLPAIANAVADALGGRRVDPPFTAEKLWRALRG
jgi:carbon-monoxide dehydrogenase large subunit